MGWREGATSATRDGGLLKSLRFGREGIPDPRGKRESFQESYVLPTVTQPPEPAVYTTLGTESVNNPTEVPFGPLWRRRRS